MRSIPADIAVDPIPDDFNPPITDDGRLLRWGGTISGSRYELGLRPERTTEAIDQALSDLKLGVWQLQEFARLGRLDLMAYASVDRHKDRPLPIK